MISMSGGLNWKTRIEIVRNKPTGQEELKRCREWRINQRWSDAEIAKHYYSEIWKEEKRQHTHSETLDCGLFSMIYTVFPFQY